MKISFALVAITGLALMGCNRGASDNSANGSTNQVAGTGTNSANAAAPPMSPATPAAGAPVDRNFLVGTWGSPGDCTETVTFNADGTATNSSDPGVARWALSGDTLTITPPNKPPQPGRAARSGDNLTIYAPDGQSATLTPCAAGAANAAEEEKAKASE